MAIDVFNLLAKEKLFQECTGLTPDEFWLMLPVFEDRWERRNCRRKVNGKARKLPVFKPSKKQAMPYIEEKLFFILYFIKSNPKYYEMQLEFGLSKGAISQWIQLLSEIFRETLSRLHCLPARTAEELYRLLERLEGGQVVILDGTERPLERSTDPEAQQDHYSGKKKTHTVKNNLLIHILGLVLYLSETVEGRVHDKALADRDPLRFPDGTVLYQDTGYQGHAPEGATVLQPTKKPRGKELSADQKAENQSISRVRVKVEHEIGHVKGFSVVKEVCRVGGYFFRDLVMELASGLHNFRTSIRRGLAGNITNFA